MTLDEGSIETTQLSLVFPPSALRGSALCWVAVPLSHNGASRSAADPTLRVSNLMLVLIGARPAFLYRTLIMLSDTSSDYETLLADEKAHSKLADSEQRRRIGSFLFRRLIFATLILGAVVLCYGSLPRSRIVGEADAWGYLGRHHVISGQEDLNRVNSTLGFQKVIAINLPHRLDKKDELTLMGYASDINVDFLSGRLTEDLKESGMPHLRYNINISTLVAAYRAHLDAWQHVVENRLTTALIMEDDIDWDVDVK
jgi:hypothetical protein